MVSGLFWKKKLRSGAVLNVVGRFAVITGYVLSAVFISYAKTKDTDGRNNEEDVARETER
jgi:FtsH-binding integral membrane protein